MSRVLLIMLLFTVKSCQSQDIDKKELVKYQTAYNYVMNLNENEGSGKGICVSDTLVYIDMTTFWEYLISEKQEQKKFVITLDSIDNARRFKHFQSDLIKKNFNSNKTSRYSLFFSKVYDNLLIAELIDNKGNANFGYNRITAFNKSKQFLFKFDGNDKIVSVYTTNMEYN